MKSLSRVLGSLVRPESRSLHAQTEAVRESYRGLRHLGSEGGVSVGSGIPPAAWTAGPVVSVRLRPGQTLVISSGTAHAKASPWLLGFLCGGAFTSLGFAACGMAPSAATPVALLAQEEGGPAAWLAARLPWPLGLHTAKASALTPADSASGATSPGSLPMPWLLQPESGGAGGAAASAALGAGAMGASVGAPAAAAPDAGEVALLRGSIARAAAAAAPAVVHIEASAAEPSGGGGGANAGGLFSPRQLGGSGFIYDASGYILTNAHVVAPAAERGSPLAVHLQDGRMYEGRVVALDGPSDLAVVRVAPEDPLPTVQLGSSRALRLGEWVIALGSPLLLRHSVTAGIVSCTERSGSELGLAGARHGYIQTDAAVNTGNSGGPLINLDGRVIGINNRKVVAADGVSFAIPIDCAKEVMEDLSRYGRVVRPWVGVTLAEIKRCRMRQLQARRPGFPSSITSGIVVESVQRGSPAAAAGLQEDDVLVGLAPGGIARFVDLLKASIGRPLPLRVVRQRPDGSGYETLDLNLTPTEAPPG